MGEPIVNCPACNNTKLSMCHPDRCFQTWETDTGRGWECDVDTMAEKGCPPCKVCCLAEWNQLHMESLLRSLPPELLAKVPKLTDKEIREALRKGKEEYDKLMQNQPSFKTSEILFR